jgi:hypothetical protein
LFYLADVFDIPLYKELADAQSLTSKSKLEQTEDSVLSLENNCEESLNCLCLITKTFMNIYDTPSLSILQKSFYIVTHILFFSNRFNFQNNYQQNNYTALFYKFTTKYLGTLVKNAKHPTSTKPLLEALVCGILCGAFGKIQTLIAGTQMLFTSDPTIWPTKFQISNSPSPPF